MGDEKTTVKNSLSWLQLAASVVSFLQAILPSFLVAWSDHLMQKNRELKQKLEQEQMKRRVDHEQTRLADENRDKSSRAIIDGFLKRK